MDVGALMREARARVGISQRMLATRVGTKQSAISMYETGVTSPTVGTLDRLLAACGVQARVVLEPLGADVDTQVASLLAGAPEIDVDHLLDLQRSLDDDPTATRMSSTPWRPTGAATWAFDGSTALRLQGLAVPEGDVALVVVLDEGTRQWLWRLPVRGTGRVVAPDWLDEDAEYVAEALAWPAACMHGLLRIRLCDALPPLLRVAIGTDGQTVPVVTVDGVEQSHPEHAEVLAAWRSRRTVAS